MKLVRLCNKVTHQSCIDSESKHKSLDDDEKKPVDSYFKRLLDVLHTSLIDLLIKCRMFYQKYLFNIVIALPTSKKS